MPLKKGNRFPLLLCLGIILFWAIGFRFYQLDRLPFGFHGDEACVGLDAALILKKGWIGPYTGRAVGQPTGPIYLTAFSIATLGSNPYAVRLVSAVFGVLAVIAFYGLLQSRFGPEAGLTGMALLAISTWSIHFSRVGFPLGVWPFFGIIALWQVDRALRTLRWCPMLLAGFAVGLGIYVYNAHYLFVLIVSGYVFFHLGVDFDTPWIKRLRGMGLYAVSLGITAYPMYHFYRLHSKLFLHHFQSASIFRSTGWGNCVSTWDQTQFLLERYFGFWRWVVFPSFTDRVDGTGITAVIPWFLLVCAVYGMKRAWALAREPLIRLAFLMVVLLPLSVVFSMEAMARRPFLLLIALLIFAALGISAFFQRFSGWPKKSRWLVQGACGMLLAFAFVRESAVYFRKLQEDNRVGWVFCEELVRAIDYMKGVPGGTQVYFCSDRWSLRYETVQFLAPQLRAMEGKAILAETLKNKAYPGRGVFVLEQSYRIHLNALLSIFPAVTVIYGIPTASEKWKAFQNPNYLPQPSFIAIQF